MNYKAQNPTETTLGAAEDPTRSLCAPSPRLHETDFTFFLFFFFSFPVPRDGVMASHGGIGSCPPLCSAARSAVDGNAPPALRDAAEPRTPEPPVHPITPSTPYATAGEMRLVAAPHAAGRPLLLVGGYWEHWEHWSGHSGDPELQGEGVSLSPVVRRDRGEELV